jgi:hypothetical protein
MLERSGTFWMPDYHDRYMRNEQHYHNAVRYIEGNPCAALLVGRPEDWRWSSASLEWDTEPRGDQGD